MFCDIIPANGGKDLGVAATLERLGIDASEAIAFGDGENDLSMFSAVGTSVAMGNAQETVKAAATEKDAVSKESAEAVISKAVAAIVRKDRRARECRTPISNHTSRTLTD